MKSCFKIQDDSFKDFMNDLNIVKEDYFDKLEGNECKKVLKNLDKLKQHIPVECFPFVDTLESLGNLISSVCGKNLDPNYKEVIAKFKQDFSDLRAIYDITVPNKIHFLQDHLEDQLDMTGESLGEVDDCVVEAMHQYLDKRMRISNYSVKNLESKTHGEKKLKLVLHVNGYNL